MKFGCRLYPFRIGNVTFILNTTLELPELIYLAGICFPTMQQELCQTSKIA
jgi:hypothetical protein